MIDAKTIAWVTSESNSIAVYAYIILSYDVINVDMVVPVRPLA